MGLKEHSDRAATAELQRDSALAESQQAKVDLEEAEKAFAEISQQGSCTPSAFSSVARCQQFFEAKWEHEAKILKEINEMSLLRQRIADIVDRTGAIAPDVSMSLADFDGPSPAACLEDKDASGEAIRFSSL